MAQLPVRPGHLRQRGALMPVLPARLAPAPFPQRPPRRRLVQSLAGRRPGRIPRRLPQPRLKLSDPLPRRRQLLNRPRQRSLRPGQFRAQRGHQRSHHLIPGTSIIARHTGTLPPTIAHRRSRYPADGRELLNSGDDAKRVPRGVGVDPQRLLRVIRAVIQQPGAERERPLMLGRRGQPRWGPWYPGATAAGPGRPARLPRAAPRPSEMPAPRRRLGS